MNSLEEFHAIISEEMAASQTKSLYQKKYSAILMNSQSQSDFQENEKSKNEIKETEFHKLIKKQINDLVYKDQEIGYHILLIGFDFLGFLLNIRNIFIVFICFL